MTVVPGTQAKAYIAGWEAADGRRPFDSSQSRDWRDGYRDQRQEKWSPEDQESGEAEDTGIKFI